MNKLNLKEIKDTFEGKRIFITGHTGFKGSWLTYLLTEVGADVTGFALPPTEQNNNFDLLNLKNKINHSVGDIRNFDLLRDQLIKNNPEIIFHMAAQAIVSKSYEKTVETFETNIMGSINVLESLKHLSDIKSLVYITSDKCYENVEKDEGYVESDILGGADPYSASKAAAEIVYSSYRRSFFNKRNNFGSASVRAGNVIGGGDWSKNRIIPDCIRSIEDDVPLILRNPESTRPWQHVLEPISGYLSIAKALLQDPKKYSGSWNFGPNPKDIKTVKNVAEKFFSYLNSGEIKIKKDDKAFHEAVLLQLNCEKAKKRIGWQARWRFEKTIDETAKWYKFLMEGGSAEEITKNQIKDYFNYD